MKRKGSDFEHQAIAAALPPRAANNLDGRDQLTPEPVDRAAVRAVLAGLLGNVMPDDRDIEAACMRLDAIKAAYHEAQEARRHPDQFHDAIRHAIKIGQKELIEAGPITTVVWRNGQLIARPAIFSVATMDDPAARERIKRMELQLAVLKALVGTDAPRDWHAAAPELVGTVSWLLRRIGHYRVRLRDRIIAALVPLVSGEHPTPEAVRKAIERTET